MFGLRNYEILTFENTVIGGELVGVSWVMDRKSGVYMIRLSTMNVDGEALDHAIVVNAKSRLVLDPVEMLAMEMKESVLEAWTGKKETSPRKTQEKKS